MRFLRGYYRMTRSLNRISIKTININFRQTITVIEQNVLFLSWFRQLSYFQQKLLNLVPENIKNNIEIVKYFRLSG